MAKYHINGKGVPSLCRAKEGNCPFGNEGVHFESKEGAQEFIDNMNENEYGLLSKITDKESQKLSREKFYNLHDELVPGAGKADSVAGELIRALSRIHYRFYNDGDKINEDYGKETCNGSLRFINNKLDKLKGGEEVNKEFIKLWEGHSMEKSEYKKQLNNCMAKMVGFIDKNPQLKTESNEYDSLTEFNEPEDYFDDWDSDDEYYF
ncbi:MAG TPA: hypothetical protein GXZ90_05420 [Clostridiales bacterium]|nr:hypothetical protein [Clostridiales bacterium]